MAAATDLLSARDTCRLLGISQATLYAYVSRGLLESRPGKDHRSRLYLRQDVERLAQRKQVGRGAARGAAQSLDRGLPVLETRASWRGALILAQVCNQLRTRLKHNYTAKFEGS